MRMTKISWHPACPYLVLDQFIIHFICLSLSLYLSLGLGVVRILCARLRSWEDSTYLQKRAH